MVSSSWRHWYSI